MLDTADPRPSICLVGLQNLLVLAPEYSRPGVGGAERQQTLLARALVREGFDVSMIVHDYGQPDGHVWDGIRTYKAYKPSEGIPVLRFFHPRWTRVWSAMRRADADIYYVSGAGMVIGEVAMFARRYGRKAVFRIASITDCEPEKTRIRYQRDRVLYRYGLMHADLVLAQTGTQEGLLREKLGLESRVVPSIAELGGNRRPRAERDLDVLWLTNIRQLKRPDLLLEVARRLPNITFDMVGGPVAGAEAVFEETRAAASKLPNVRFHGFVAHQATAELYERAKLFVSTSGIEGFPNTYLQSWARGTPVVAFFDPDSLIAQQGLGSAVLNVDEMQAAIERLLGNEAEWNATSARCGAYIDRNRDERSMLTPYVDAFVNLCRPARAT
jgi:glycosyltransferase involved in cell wall biosynthesis